MSSVVGLLYSSIDGNLCTSALRELRRQAAEHLLLHQRLAEAHVDAALDLPARQHRVERCGRCRARSRPSARGSSRSPGRPRPRPRRRCRSRRATGRRRRPCSGPAARGGVYEPIVPSVPNFASASTTASRNVMPLRRIVGDEDAPLREHEALRRRRRAARRPRRRAALAHALRRLDRGVAHHQRDAARVRAEVDRREVGVAGDAAHVERDRCRAPRRRSPRARRPSPGRSRSRRRTPSPGRCGRAAAARPSAASCSSRSAGRRRRGTRRRRGRRRGPSGSLPKLAASSPSASTTRRMHSARPIVPIRSQLAVSEFGLRDHAQAQLGRIDARASRRSCRAAPPGRSAAAACRGRAWGRTAACW